MAKIKEFAVYNSKGVDIGYVYQDRYDKQWSSVCFMSDIGHGGFDTREQAERDVQEMYQEHVTMTRNQIEVLRFRLRRWKEEDPSE